MDKYFMAYIIPAYNCKETLFDTIASIAMQKFKKEIEIIVVDDCSTDCYEDIINNFKGNIAIKYFKLNENSGPGVARQVGIKKAESTYVSFVDADDFLLPSAYVNVREVLMNENNIEVLITDFSEQREDYKTYVPHTRDIVWVHGKYFKRQFLIDNNICFHDTLRTHEDIYFNHLAINTSDRVVGLEFPTYTWNFKADSLTRRVYNGCYSYIEQYLKDYVEATIGPCKKLIGQNPSKYKPKMKELMVLHTLYLYFYIESFKFALPEDWYKDNLYEVKKVLDLIEETYQMDWKDVYAFVKERNVFGMIRQACMNGVGDFIEQDTYYSFLKHCSTLEYNK